MDSAASNFSWDGFFNGAGGLLDKYANFRLVKATNALQADGQAQAAADAAKASAMPAWIMPAAIIGGLGLVAVLVLRR